ncbi:MAG: adenylate/guanylate cyclase domain-containing protein, partial [Candidatus Sericytochromatia bacterium]
LAVLASQEEKNRVVSMFGQHVSPEVVNKLLSQPAELGTEVRHVCVMFLDIRNFTRFSENTDPEEVVRYLNTLYDFMIEIVNRHHGIINKFLGDGFMAVFGAPLSNGFDSRNAVHAAQEILATLEQAIRTDKIPPTAVGIGLHAGEAVTGNVGSAQRKEYTIIGDVVNVASRIEQLNKQFGSQLLISETVWESLDQAFPDAIPHDPIPIRGRREAIRIYQMA